jgi:hypothetical protein
VRVNEKYDQKRKRQKNLKKFKKTLKKVKKTVDKGKGNVVLYTSCRREGAEPSRKAW